MLKSKALKQLFLALFCLNALNQLASAQLAPPDITYTPAAGDFYNRVSQCKTWQSFPVRVYIENSALLRQSDWEAAQGAIQIWQQYFPLSLTDNVTDANISVSWHEQLPSKFNIISLSQNDTLGTTSIPSSLVNTNQPLSLHDVHIDMLLPSRYGKIPFNSFQPAFVHKLGHAIGLCGHSNQKQDLMAPYLHVEQPHRVSKSILRTVALNALTLPFGMTTMPNISTFLPFQENTHLTQRNLNTVYLLYHNRTVSKSFQQ